MTFASRIRVYLVAVAVMPPLLIMGVIYFQAVKQLEQAYRLQVDESIGRFKTFHSSLITESQISIQRFIDSRQMKARVGISGISLDPNPFGFDFVELLDSNLYVRLSHHRPGLIGNIVHSAFAAPEFERSRNLETIEYDINGAHAAISFLQEIDANRYLFAGIYIDLLFQQQLSTLLDADIMLVLDPDTAVLFERMDRYALYQSSGGNQSSDNYQSLLAGSSEAGYFLAAVFPAGPERPLLFSLMSVTGVVALVSVAAAIAIGLFITGRAKREIENLVQATSRIAGGDFTTSVMAFEEGEFSQLADSITDMTVRLRALQSKLATSEKIAAWQMMGRKLAHEIKNPLTPIAISTDDLRRSYQENLPDFANTLEQTTTTIRSEVNRMTKLLDHFVSFARMRAPVIRNVHLPSLMESISSLYAREITNKKLKLVNNSAQSKFRLDPEAIKQVLINLIKNGFETASDVTLSISIANLPDGLEIVVNDNGPGFPSDILERPFEPHISTKKDGSGLGLVICHRIVHDHGGSIDVMNRPEGGGTVRIRLPR